MKYLKSIILFLLIIVIFSIFNSILYYFDLINNNVNSILKYIIIFLSYITTGFYIGKKSYKNKYIEGLKIWIILTLLSVFITIIIPNISFSIKYIFNSLLTLLLIEIGILISIKIKK